MARFGVWYTWAAEGLAFTSMAQGKASERDLATAYGILKGKSVSQAMRDAGYAETSARTLAGKVEARLRGLGLLPTPEDALDAIALLRATIFADGGKGLVSAYNSQLARAQAGDVGAFKAIMAYLVGAPSQAVQVSGPGGGPVAVEQRIIVEWPGDRQGDNGGEDGSDDD